ncbi:hypothetical protein LTR91_014673 [Friedmanniomyces endolithicus]|uniref:Zinc finger PHD-type domain-containing protein n=2 Tax=Friedmanniomyces endolithicus TaxID=329885 RepID=A0AAN6QN95_9PEZI|nr:hypothetical protein LTR35_016592 [Friedmanniomyces endolithicus]KAK0285391.1 hypothetical protein LTS00_011021 [Friedmanniomyces endolithicus]KAK0322547.1 hypothetical protein LTR82_006507 [Friedmanniomyces endolithicus]KAK0898678.1 hypothetical protein LTR57_021510 [Friedmanniomyces endolithicus]KAK0973224.1 hypothetical protein LTS01_014691 [Friedmanniomyces endolithicus]
MADGLSADPKTRKVYNRPLLMRTMSVAFADSKTIKCKCTEGRPDNGHSLVQCKRCENWLHVNCMLGEQYTFTQYEARTGYKCAPSCDEYLQEHHSTDEPAESAKDASPRRLTETDNTNVTKEWKSRLKHSTVLFSTPPTKADENDFYASIGRRASSDTAGSSKREAVASSSARTGASAVRDPSSGIQMAKSSVRALQPQSRPARSTLRHQSDLVQSPSIAGSEYDESARQRGRKSPAGLSEEEAFYASPGQRSKAPPVASKGEPRGPDTVLPKPTAEQKLPELLRASSRSLVDSPMKDARNEIRALRHRHNTNIVSGLTERTFDAHNNNLLKRKASTLDAKGEDPVVEWVMATGAPKVLCSCEAGPAGVYQDYVICQRCKTLQHKRCIPPAETDTVAQGKLCEPCRDVEVEKMYNHHREMVEKGKADTQALRERLQNERKHRNEKLRVIVAANFWKNYCDLPSTKDSLAVRELTSTYFDDRKGTVVPVHPAPVAWIEAVLASIHSLVSPANKDLVMQLARKDELLFSLTHPDRLRKGLSELAVLALHHGSLKGKRQELGVLAEVLGLEPRGTYWHG